jgi:hypothetical protein
MDIPQLVTLQRLSGLENSIHKLNKRVEATEHKQSSGESSLKDAEILATQAFLIAYYQLATFFSNPAELWDGFKHILEEQGLSQEALDTIGQWVTKSCETIERSGFPELPSSPG